MKRLRPRMPSPALVVAMIALFSSLGGVSYGLARGSIDGREVRNRSLTGNDVKRDSLGGTVIKESTLAPVPQTAGVTHFAAVSAEGAPLSTRGVLTTFKNSEQGDYLVVFDKEIRNCAYIATIVNAGPTENALRGQIGVGLSVADARALQVQTTNAAGAPAKRSFHVAVLC